MDQKGLDWCWPVTAEGSDLQPILYNISLQDPGGDCQNTWVKLADAVRWEKPLIYSALQEEWHSSGELDHGNGRQEQMPWDWEQEFLL